MSTKCEEEFNPWPSFVDIFSSVILVMLLFLLVTLVNLGYYAQFKYKLSYTGSITTNELIMTNNRSSDETDKDTTKVSDPAAAAATNSDINLRIINEQKQELLLLQKQIQESEYRGSKEKTEELESPGIDVADKEDTEKEDQAIIGTDDYIIVTYSGNEVFVDDGIVRKIKQFLSIAKENYKNHKILISSSDIKGQISATIAKQISLARTISTRNLIRKFGYEKKDVRVDLLGKVDVKEKIEDKNGYLIIKIKK